MWSFGRSSRRWLAVVGLALASVLVAVAPRAGAAQQQAASGVVHGVVRDEAGNGIAGARVAVGGGAGVVTDAAGGFTLRGLALGTATLVVRRLGYAPLESRIVIGDSTGLVDLRVKPIAAALPAVRVQARAEPFQSRLAGFYARRDKKLGYYISRADIEQRNDYSMTSALRRLPGVKVFTMPGALGRSIHLAGAQCPPLVFVDGFAASLGSFDLDMIDLDGVEGVEVYPHGSSVPADFASSQGSECGVIAIWSRPTRSRRVAETAGADKPDVAALVAEDSVFLPGSVDRQAVLLPGSGQPSYPDSLYAAGVPGHVLAQFVVDTAGEVEPKTLEIVSSTMPAFAEAVKNALLAAQFKPARRGGSPVRELVSVPFDFDPRDNRGANTSPD